jgi:hypothetical protein
MHNIEVGWFRIDPRRGADKPRAECRLGTRRPGDTEPIPEPVLRTEDARHCLHE